MEPNSEDFLSSYELNLSVAKDTNIRITLWRVRKTSFLERSSQNALSFSVYLNHRQNFQEPTKVRLHHYRLVTLSNY